MNNKLLLNNTSIHIFFAMQLTKNFDLLWFSTSQTLRIEKWSSWYIFGTQGQPVVHCAGGAGGDKADSA